MCERTAFALIYPSYYRVTHFFFFLSLSLSLRCSRFFFDGKCYRQPFQLISHSEQREKKISTNLHDVCVLRAIASHRICQSKVTRGEKQFNLLIKKFRFFISFSLSLPPVLSFALFFSAWCFGTQFFRFGSGKSALLVCGGSLWWYLLCAFCFHFHALGIYQTCGNSLSGITATTLSLSLSLAPTISVCTIIESLVGRIFVWFSRFLSLTLSRPFFFFTLNVGQINAWWKSVLYHFRQNERNYHSVVFCCCSDSCRKSNKNNAAQKLPSEMNASAYGMCCEIRHCKHVSLFLFSRSPLSRSYTISYKACDVVW